jgi:hypothetical protein
MRQISLFPATENRMPIGTDQYVLMLISCSEPFFLDLFSGPFFIVI